MDPDILIPISGMLTGGLTFVVLGWTVRHWVDRHYDHKRALHERADEGSIGQIHERLGVLEEQVAARIMDLEERMDFTERVLTRGGEHEPAKEGTS
jgi:hypothetical protein